MSAVDRDRPAGARIAPLADPFVLDGASARASAMHRRLIVLATPDDEHTRELLAAFRADARATVATGDSALFGRALDRIWSAFQVDSDVGLGPFVTGEQLLRSLRTLTDVILGEAVGEARALVEWSPSSATPEAVTRIRSIYPDATVIVPATVAAALPAHAQGPGLLVDASPTDVETLLADPPPASSRDAAVPAPPLLAPRRLVLVVGCGRSGTTWVEELLMTHPGVGGVHRTESWLFQQLDPLWQEYERRTGVLSQIPESVWTGALRGFCDSIFGAAMRHHRPQAEFFVEKTPMHVFHLPQIQRVYPDAWLLHLIRDGRDVARSMSQVPFFDLPDPVAAAEVWRDVVTIARRDGRRFGSYRELRYEDVVADPVAAMTSAFEWFGAPTSPAVAESVRRAAGERVSAHAGTGTPVGPGSWRSLPPATLSGIYRRAGALLVEEGYASRRDVWRSRWARLG